MMAPKALLCISLFFTGVALECEKDGSCVEEQDVAALLQRKIETESPAEDQALLEGEGQEASDSQQDDSKWGTKTQTTYSLPRRRTTYVLPRRRRTPPTVSGSSKTGSEDRCSVNDLEVKTCLQGEMATATCSARTSCVAPSDLNGCGKRLKDSCQSDYPTEFKHRMCKSACICDSWKTTSGQGANCAGVTTVAESTSACNREKASTSSSRTTSSFSRTTSKLLEQRSTSEGSDSDSRSNGSALDETLQEKCQ